MLFKEDIDYTLQFSIQLQQTTATKMGRFLFSLLFVISTGIILVSANTLPILRGAVNQVRVYFVSTF